MESVCGVSRCREVINRMRPLVPLSRMCLPISRARMKPAQVDARHGVPGLLARGERRVGLQPTRTLRMREQRDGVELLDRAVQKAAPAVTFGEVGGKEVDTVFHRRRVDVAAQTMASSAF